MHWAKLATSKWSLTWPTSENRFSVNHLLSVACCCICIFKWKIIFYEPPLPRLQNKTEEESSQLVQICSPGWPGLSKVNIKETRYNEKFWRFTSLILTWAFPRRFIRESCFLRSCRISYRFQDCKTCSEGNQRHLNACFKADHQLSLPKHTKIQIH